MPALYKIFDEAGVNAADHWSHTHAARNKAHRMTTLDLTADRATGRLCVRNGGRAIPIRRLKAHGGRYAGEVMFGRLLSSSNYNDDDERVTGGRNGYGIKCANIYSTEFVVEACDGKQHYRQVWRRNMFEVGEPEVRPAAPGAAQFTSVSFVPDYARLGLAGLTEGMAGLMRRRAVDLAAWFRGTVAVTFNGAPVTDGGLEDYARAYVGDDRALFHQRSRGGRWEFVVTCGESGAFEQVSFVNGIATSHGGRHVEHVVQPLCRALAAAVTKKAKVKVTPAAVRAQLLVFVRAVVVNPAFDGQVKDTLTTPVARFGSRYDLPKTLPDRLLRAVPALVDRAVAHAEFRSRRALKRTHGSKSSSVRGIPKHDATEAGGRRRARARSS